EGREGLPGGTGHPRRARLDNQLRQGAASLSRGERDLLGAQPAGPLGDPRPVSARPTRAALLALAALAGCATRAELVQQDHQLRTILQDQRKQLQEVQKEVERLRADIEEGHPRRSGGGGAGDDRLSALEQRLADLERGTGSGGLPPAATPPSGSPAPPSATASAPPAGRRPPAVTPDDEWRQELAREQKAAGTLTAPDRPEH